MATEHIFQKTLSNTLKRGLEGASAGALIGIPIWLFTPHTLHSPIDAITDIPFWPMAIGTLIGTAGAGHALYKINGEQNLKKGILAGSIATVAVAAAEQIGYFAGYGAMHGQPYPLDELAVVGGFLGATFGAINTAAYALARGGVFNDLPIPRLRFR